MWCAHEGDAKSMARNIVEGRNTTCEGFSYHFDRIESDGLLEARFYFPFSKLSHILNSDREFDLLAEWFETVNDSVVRLSIEEHKRFGKCVVVHRVHYIPKEERDKWLGSSRVAVEEQEMLCRLIQRQKK